MLFEVFVALYLWGVLLFGWIGCVVWLLLCVEFLWCCLCWCCLLHCAYGCGFWVVGFIVYGFLLRVLMSVGVVVLYLALEFRFGFLFVALCCGLPAIDGGFDLLGLAYSGLLFVA